MGADNTKFKVLEYGNGSLYKTKDSSKEPTYFWKVNNTNTYNICGVEINSNSESSFDCKNPIENVIIIHECLKCKNTYDEFFLPKIEDQTNFLYTKSYELTSSFRLKYRNNNPEDIKLYSISFGMVSFSFPVYIIKADTCHLRY